MNAYSDWSTSTSLQGGTLEYILIVYCAASKRRATQYFCLLCRQFISCLRESIHTGVYFADYIVRCIRSRRKLTALHYDATVSSLWGFCDFYLFARRSLSTAAGRSSMKCTSQRAARSCTALVSHTNVDVNSKLKIEIVPHDSNICDLLCTSRRLTLLSRLWATRSW